MPIATIPTEDFTVNTPAGADWLGSTSKVDWHIYGATQTGRQIWVAWNGAHCISGKQENAFAYPQIGLAMIDVDGGLLGQRFIWNPNYGFAWPVLATSANGDVGLAFCSAGEQDDSQYGVATLTGTDQVFLLITSGPSMGAGGHYIGVRRSYPSEILFCGAGFNQLKPARTAAMPRAIRTSPSSAPRLRRTTAGMRPEARTARSPRPRRLDAPRWERRKRLD